MDLICATAHLHFCFRNLFKDMSMFDDDMIPGHSLSGFDSSMALKEGGSDARAWVGRPTVSHHCRRCGVPLRAAASLAITYVGRTKCIVIIQ